ncbi:hypothetical protein NUU61_010012 [Penicillium alfredii]|uniref:Zn(2)-C6 fungal-type domain-containing protein n=1 Tax=Penicillium alfredii TaxID=1506179 RepID=A0A9W9JU36_9EURO|nr:uncharacterized protein NUU61_010012 [Penicillium alfredii]KAJ5081748.1 hypothetical protein NUU61_010012 [Penicillium alfredii]
MDTASLDSGGRQPHQSRQRVKRACETCKVRKRKCDGREPCGFCLRYEYGCSYGTHARRKATVSKSPRPASTTEAIHHADADTDANLTERPTRAESLSQQRIEASSGTAFPQVLGLELSQDDAPRVYGVSWNLGPRKELAPSVTRITALLSIDEMESFAEIYLAHIHPIYAILDADVLKHEIATRWENPHVTDDYDPILYGAAALGSLYCGHDGHVREGELVQCARNLLEATSIMRKPSLHHAIAWVLRTLYLRSTNSAHAAWMASCITIHVIEATGAHRDSGLEALLDPETTFSKRDEETRRRLIWVAITLNAWISFEYGRPRVLMNGVACNTPSPRDGDFTVDLIRMYQISEKLDPNHVNNPVDLQESLSQIQLLVVGHDVLALSRTNLAFAIYRRLRVASSAIPNDVLTRVIELGNLGLDAAVRLAEARRPWWHVANVPFQFVCTLLAMDTRESLLNVGHALRAFKTIAQYFRTRNIQHALETAEFLVRLSQHKKKGDLDALNGGLQEVEFSEPTQNIAMIDIMNVWGDLDWDAFLNADMPLFDETQSQR